MEELDNHSRTIIHIDLDCFYAQVEMLKNPALETVPLGIQQKNIVVTSNYVAREFGVGKCMLITEAKKLCPNLVLVKGEDLHDYRQISYKVTALLQKFSNSVERLGLDENFLDVSNLVKEKSSVQSKIVGNVFGETSELCDCGCSVRLKIGTMIAAEIRDLLKSELGLTSCAGISHNKLLAKIVGSKHKPNQQTVVFPNNGVELICSLNSVGKIPGIGKAMSDQLEEIGVRSVEDLQNADMNKLVRLIGAEKAKFIYDLSYGIDKTPVKSSGRPQSIGLEDSCKAISVEKEVKEKLMQLLNRLLLLVQEDGRIPKTIKLTVRKFDKDSKLSTRETRQCNINTTLFNSSSNPTVLNPSNESKIMSVIMRLFSKSVNINRPYHITLLGLSFTKFLERPNTKNSIASFLRKDIEVQSVTSIRSHSKNETVPVNNVFPSTSFSPDNNSDYDNEPSTKKLKFANNIVAKRRCPSSESDDSSSPSKLKVSELRLNSTESQVDTNQNICCPPNADEDVFRELPREMQQELWEEYKQQRDRDKNMSNSAKKTKPNSILNYFVKN